MKYQVTCDNCEKQFLVEGEPGQTVKCTCPGCGGTMQLSLPLSAAPDAAPQAAGTYTGAYTGGAGMTRRKKKRSINPIMMGITIGISVLAVLAIVLFVASRYGNHPIEPETSGYVSDTVATQQVYELPPDPVVPEADTTTVSIPEEKPEEELEQETEAEEPAEADTTAVE